MITGKVLPIWDIWIRLFHWSLAISVGVLFYTGLTGDLFFDWHKLTGEFVLLLIVFRLIWGVVGSSNARLSALFKSPAEGVRHLKHLAKKDVPQEREHNAAGAWAVIAMLIMLGTQAVTGLFIADEDELVEGALYGDVSSATSDLLYRVHNINAELLQIIVIVHVLMIALYGVYAKRNLLLPMITGKLNWNSAERPPPLFIQRWWVGILCFVPCAAAIGWLGGWY